MWSGPADEGTTLSRFADYFVICGLDPHSGLEVLNTYEIDGNCETSTATPLERSYKPKILAHYPDNLPWNPFDKDAVRNLCLPDGLLFRTQKCPLDPLVHPFLITRENGSRSHGLSYVFFEPVDSPHVSQAIQTLQAMHLTELSSAKNYHQKRGDQNRKIRSAQRSLHKQAGGGGGGRQRAQYLADIEGNPTRSLPRHFKLAAHKQQSLLTQSFYDSSKDTLYVTKAIGLICPLPHVQLPQRFLTGLESYLRGRSDEDLSLESYVYHLLYYVPLPSPGKSVRLSYFNEIITCARPEPTELPLFDYFMIQLFKLLDLGSFLQLFTSVLLENQVLLYSKDLYRLMLVAESVTGLLFPFVWQHVYVPILPSTLHHFLDAPVPFIMGLHAVRDSAADNIPCEANLCFVDIDSNTVTVPEDLPLFPHREDLIAELATVLNKYNIPVGNVNKEVRSSRTSPYHRRRRGARGAGRKNSWSHDSDSGMSSNEESLSLNGSQLNISMTNSMSGGHPGHQQRNPPGSLPSSHERGGWSEESSGEPFEETYLRNLKFNSSVREIFCNRFVHMFASYDHFLSQPHEDSGRLFVHNFDKATFLSDQPDQNLPFLSRFIETQMFASMIDRKIASLSGDAELDPNLIVFEQRIKILRSRYGDSLVRTPSYEPCSNISKTEERLEGRFLNPDFEPPPVNEVMNLVQISYPKPTQQFPLLSPLFLNTGPTDTRNMKLLKEGRSRGERATPSQPDYPSIRSVFQPKQTNSSPASIAQANWEFIKTLLQDSGRVGLGRERGSSGRIWKSGCVCLLQECKSKTKRMLVEKMGVEAVALGHGELSSGISGIEENTLVASLCDLLERIWAHGLHVKQKGRSPLWNYLTNYQESEACKDSSKPIDPTFLTPDYEGEAGRGTYHFFTYLRKARKDLSAMASELNLNVVTGGGVSSGGGATTGSTQSPEKRESRARPLELPSLIPLPVSIAFDMRNVQGMSEIKTEIGYARAWIRLSLEKKVLSKHLRALLADDQLLRGFYKRTAFLRSEEEREQFLYHLLTLNAADYVCFTNTYLNIVLPYRVLIFPSKRFNISTTTANVWLSVSGTLAETGSISVPKNSLEFVFQHKNLGLLTNMHLGHDNSGVSPKWLVEQVVLRNEVTGHVVKFPCGRWLGRDIDDGSTERLLVGEVYHEVEESPLPLRTPPRARSPSLPRRSIETRPSEIQEALGNAVNGIVKYFFKPEKDRGSLTVLLCGEHGLVASLEQVFLFGFKSSRLFGKNIYLWDYLVRVQEVFEGKLTDEDFEMIISDDDGSGLTDHVNDINSYCELIHKINYHASSLGKNGKFQLLICLCAREHLLPRLGPVMTNLQITRQLYEEHSFLREPDLLQDLVQVLLALDDYDIVLEQSLSKGIE